MKNQLNKRLIEDLNESSNKEFIEKINEQVFSLVSATMEDLSKKSPFIRTEKCVLQAVNEAYLGTITQLSEFAYFLGIENPQIEMNTKEIKNYLKFLWREFKANFRLGKKKYKKQKQTKSVQPISKYKLSDAISDFVQIISEYLSETSIVYQYFNHVEIIGKDDFGTGVRIKIYFCCYESHTGEFKLYQERKNKFLTISFRSRFQNLNEKIENCGTMFVDMVKIFNAIYSKTFNKIPNQILLESLIFNCPNSLFEQGNLYNTFVNVSNYIRTANPNTFVSICDPNKTIFQEELIFKANQQIEFSKIINMLNEFKY